MNSFEIIAIDRDSIGFIDWAEKLWVSPETLNSIGPIRRVLSLMRLEKAKTMILETVSWNNSQYCSNGTCLSCYPGSPISCKEYLDILSKNYNYKKYSKTCYRISFFKNTLTYENFNKQSTDSFLGYCIIHKDDLLHQTSMLPPAKI